MQDLAGYVPHTTKSGVCHKAFDNDFEAIMRLKEFLNFLPSNNKVKPPRIPTSDPWDREDKYLDTIIPPDSKVPYDMRHVISSIVDEGNFFELAEDFAKNVIGGFARMDGEAVLLIATQPKELAGALDINSAVKGARLVRFANAFNIPIVTLIDVPGFLPGAGQENNGLIRNGAKLLYAYAEATVPKIAVTLRKSYGGAYIVLSSKHLRSDYNFAWPTAEIAVMGPDGAQKILTHGELGNGSAEEKAEYYRRTFATPLRAAERGFLDDVIAPRKTRKYIIEALRVLKNKQVPQMFAKKLGNIPL